MNNQILDDTMEKYFDFGRLDEVIEKSIEMIYSPNLPKDFKYDRQTLSLRIVYDGYTTLPKIYHNYFLDPLKNFIERYDYAQILSGIDSNGFLKDVLSTIHQRIDKVDNDSELKTFRAFDEILSDLYDGYLSSSERYNIKLPDFQALSPLVFWGPSNISPYIWTSETTRKIGIESSFVCMPKSYTQNIILWSATGHEVGGHDILHSDKGLLQEISKVVKNEIQAKSEGLGLNKPITICGREASSVSDFAVDYWNSTIDETASDICSVLNLGPAAGIGLVVSLLSRSENKKFINEFPINEVHPIDVLRILLVIESIRCMKNLDINVINGYTNFFEGIIDKYCQNKNELKLYTTRSNHQKYYDVIVPFHEMRETAKIVANTIIYGNLKTLNDHHLSEINNWNNHDEILVQRLIKDLSHNNIPSLDPGPDGNQVYAAHILSAGILEIIKSAKITQVTSLCVEALNKLFESNPVWQGFPVKYRSDADRHNLLPLFSIPTYIQKNK